MENSLDDINLYTNCITFLYINTIKSINQVLFHTITIKMTFNSNKAPKIQMILTGIPLDYIRLKLNLTGLLRAKSKKYSEPSCDSIEDIVTNLQCL